MDESGDLVETPPAAGGFATGALASNPPADPPTTAPVGSSTTDEMAEGATKAEEGEDEAGASVESGEATSTKANVVSATTASSAVASASAPEDENALQTDCGAERAADGSGEAVNTKPSSAGPAESSASATSSTTGAAAGGGGNGGTAVSIATSTAAALSAMNGGVAGASSFPSPPPRAPSRSATVRSPGDVHANARPGILRRQSADGSAPGSPRRTPSLPAIYGSDDDSGGGGGPVALFNPSQHSALATAAANASGVPTSPLNGVTSPRKKPRKQAMVTMEDEYAAVPTADGGVSGQTRNLSSSANSSAAAGALSMLSSSKRSGGGGALRRKRRTDEEEEGEEEGDDADEDGDEDEGDGKGRESKRRRMGTGASGGGADEEGGNGGGEEERSRRSRRRRRPRVRTDDGYGEEEGDGGDEDGRPSVAVSASGRGGRVTRGQQSTLKAPPQQQSQLRQQQFIPDPQQQQQQQQHTQQQQQQQQHHHHQQQQQLQSLQQPTPPISSARYYDDAMQGVSDVSSFPGTSAAAHAHMGMQMPQTSPHQQPPPQSITPVTGPSGHVEGFLRSPLPQRPPSIFNGLPPHFWAAHPPLPPPSLRRYPVFPDDYPEPTLTAMAHYATPEQAPSHVEKSLDEVIATPRIEEIVTGNGVLRAMAQFPLVRESEEEVLRTLKAACERLGDTLDATNEEEAALLAKAQESVRKSEATLAKMKEANDRMFQMLVEYQPRADLILRRYQNKHGRDPTEYGMVSPWGTRRAPLSGRSAPPPFYTPR